MKKSLSILLCLVMLLSVITIVPFSASAESVDVVGTGTSRTSAEAVAWVGSQNGKALDYDGAYGAQCVDLIMYYYQYLGVSSPGGNAKDYTWNALPSGWTRTSSPSAGDIVVWGAGSSLGKSGYYADGTYGHIGIVTAVSGGYMDYYDQNAYPQGQVVGGHSGHLVSSAATFIHPNFAGSAPHTHNYNTYVYNSSSHPHYGCYQCSCGDVKENTSQPHYSASCSDCNHTVSYNANGGSGAPDSQTKKYLSTLYLSNTVPTRTNYVFLGWSTDRYATSAQYQPGDAYNSDSNLSLYAIWKLKGYTLKYDLTGGNARWIEVDGRPYYPFEDKVVPFGEDYTLPKESPWKNNHKFLGWSPFDNPDYGVYYRPGDTVSSLDLTGAAYNNQITLYAVWQEPEPLILGDNSGVLNKGDIKYYSFTPQVSGFYLQRSDLDSEKACAIDLGANSGRYGSHSSIAYLEQGKTYYINVSNSDDHPVHYTIHLEDTNIKSFKANATVYAKKNATGVYYAWNFLPEITLFDDNDREVFKGNDVQLYNNFKINLDGTLETNAIGENTMTVELWGGSAANKMTAEMNVVIIDAPVVTGIQAVKREIITLYKGDDTYAHEATIRKAAEKVSLIISYDDGTQKSVGLDSIYEGRKFMYNGYTIRLSADNDPLKLGNNLVNVEYRGFTTSFDFEVVESPIARMAVISSPTIYDNEYFNEYYSGSSGYDLGSLLKDHPIKLRVFYKNGTSKTVTLDSKDIKAAEQLGDTQYDFYYDEHITEWGNPDAANYITINYLGASVDVYIDVLSTEHGLDKAVDYEIIDIPNLDPEHYSYIPDITGAKIKLIFESGTTREVVIDSPRISGSFYLDNNKYNYYLKGDSTTGVYIQMLGIEKLLVEACPNTIVSVDASSSSDYLVNICKIVYSDGKTVFMKRNGVSYSNASKPYVKHDRYFGLSLLSKKEWYDIDYSSSLEEEFNHAGIQINNSNVYKAKQIATVIGKNCSIRDDYQVDDKSEEDIDHLIETLSFFLNYSYGPNRSDFDINRNAISYETAFYYLNKYYGLTKYEIYASKYYLKKYNMIIVPDNNKYDDFWRDVNVSYFGSTNYAKLYYETLNSYIFEYSDTYGTRYIEFSKDLKLLSITDTAPEKSSEHAITMAEGYSSRETAFSGNTVTVCTNVPEGKEFVKWTSDKNVQFADDTKVETTFTMMDTDVEITPVFKDIEEEEPAILGDADGDGKVTAVDVTRIMLDIVRLNPGVDHDTLMNGDVDQNGILAITDVTYIQRYLAKLETPFAIGEAIG